MSGWELMDDDIKDWCVWFRSYYKRLVGRPNVLVAKEVNVSENWLTGRGIQSLLETLTACRVSVTILKLHHNQLEDGDAVATFVRGCCGSLRELHLSHNWLTTSAAAEIVLAAAEAEDETGLPCYPRHGLTPLWLRIEQNYLSAAELTEHVEPAYKAMEREGAAAICNVSTKACTPHSCAKHRFNPPVIHAKHLGNQRSMQASRRFASTDCTVSDGLHRRRSASPAEEPLPNTAPAKSETPPKPPAEEILSLLMPGKDGDPEPEWKQPGPGGVLCTPQVSAAKEDEEEEKKTEEEAIPPPPIEYGRWMADVIVADVLRWDEDLCRWVKDVIEIAEAPKPRFSESGGRFRIGKELGHRMGNELKNFLSRTPAVGEGYLPSLLQDEQSIEGASQPAEGSPTNHRSAGNARSSRRGSQPFSSDVKQANWTALNPRATEFYPTVSKVVKAPAFSSAEPATPPPPALSGLNPNAAEFRPLGSSTPPTPPPPDQLPQSMRGISESIKSMNRPSTSRKAGTSDPALVKVNPETSDQTILKASPVTSDPAVVKAGIASATAWLEAAARDVDVPKPPPQNEPDPKAEARKEVYTRSSSTEEWLSGSMDEVSSEDEDTWGRRDSSLVSSSHESSSVGKVLRRAITVTSAGIALGAVTAALARSRQRNG